MTLDRLYFAVLSGVLYAPTKPLQPSVTRMMRVRGVLYNTRLPTERIKIRKKAIFQSESGVRLIGSLPDRSTSDCFNDLEWRLKAGPHKLKTCNPLGSRGGFSEDQPHPNPMGGPNAANFWDVHAICPTVTRFWVMTKLSMERVFIESTTP